jgi:hypothetical protein
MLRTGSAGPSSGGGLPAHISWALLNKVYPPGAIDRAIEECGRLEQRRRLLPSRLVTLYVMGLALFSRSSYEDVMQSLIDAQIWAVGQSSPWTPPSKAALFKARSRLGPEPLKHLFGTSARPMAIAGTGTGFYGSRRLMSLDSARLHTPDTPANVAAFGRPEVEDDGSRLLPQVRVVGLTETGTRAILHAAIGGVQEPRDDLVGEVLARDLGGTLVLAGRSFYSHRMWTAGLDSGADLLWRAEIGEVLAVERQHADGSYSSWTSPDGMDESPRRIRVVEYPLVGHDTPRRLITSMLDPVAAPASELVELYSRRSTIASAFDGINAVGTSSRMVLRSKVPEGVLQEAWGYLCVHYAMRWLLNGVDDQRATS